MNKSEVIKELEYKLEHNDKLAKEFSELHDRYMGQGVSIGLQEAIDFIKENLDDTHKDEGRLYTQRSTGVSK